MNIRRLRLSIVIFLALAPLALVAQSTTQTRPGLLNGGAAVAIPFTGPGWQDKVLNYEGYVMPPPELASAVLAPRGLNVTLTNLSPDKKWFLEEINDGPVPMAIFGKPFDELGGVFIDYRANRLRSVTLRNTVGIQVIAAADGTKKPLATPPGLRVTGARWTPDSTGVVYMTLGDEATHVWITDVATNKPRQITKTPVLATFVTTFEFVNAGKQIALVVPPDGRSARPLAPVMPAGPEIRISEDHDRNRLRTFPSLMTTPYDYKLLEWHATSQLAVIDVATSAMTKFGQPAMITAFDMSPDGKYARVTRMTKPFSYLVPVSSFGSIQEVWDAAGTALAKISSRDLDLGVQANVADPPDPGDPQAPQAGGGGGRGNAADQNGKRELTWRPDGQGFTYLEQEPAPPGAANGAGANGRGAGGRFGGAQAAPQGPPRKDRLMQWLAPFSDSSAKLLYENPTRMTGVRFSPDGQLIFFSENNAMVAVYLADPAQKHVLTPPSGAARGDATPNPAQNAAASPAAGRGRGGNDNGTLVGASGTVGGGGRGAGGGGGRGGAAPVGGPVLLSADGQAVFFQGQVNDRNPQQVGPKTFIDRVVIKTGERTRIFESDNTGVWERVSSVLDSDAKKLILTKENPTSPPQQYLVENGARRQLTNNEDMAADLSQMIVQRFTVARPDGFSFRTTVYLPHDYQAGTRLPGFFWFYPREYSTQEEYDQPNSTFNKNAFQQFTSLSKQYLTRLGYAVIENDAPIVGAQGQMNNNYVNDLRNDLSATIDELDRRGLVDRQRLAIGGHSYGAFSTVNAMVNTPFFKAGIAGDGAYNRTLTPLGFQNERRDLWEAPSVYLDMSPFLKANQLSGALLMYHGMHDQNVGTDPINSLRLFHALNGLGKTVALYRYPDEDHGPAARETLLDLWARWAAWLDKYVKNPQPVVVKPAANAPARGGR